MDDQALALSCATTEHTSDDDFGEAAITRGDRVAAARQNVGLTQSRLVARVGAPDAGGMLALEDRSGNRLNVSAYRDLARVFG
jgi:hypothetical protein